MLCKKLISHGHFGMVVLIIAALVGLTAFSSAIARGATVAASSSTRTMPKIHIKASPTGTITYSDWEFPDTLNPLQTTEEVSVETINSILGSPLLYNQHAKLVPYMLTAVPSVKNGMIKDGGKLIILKLRPGQRWSNGQEITNQDILFGWRMYMDPTSGPACLGTCDQIATITLRGKYEADLHMRHVYAAVLANGLPPVYPHNSKALGLTPHQAAVTLATKTTFNYESPSYVTSGPYQVSDFVRNDRIELTPNPYYQGPGAAFAKHLIFVFYSSKDGMIAAAKNGQTDVTTDYTLADLTKLGGHNGAYTLYQTPSFTFEHLELNALDPTYNGKPNPLHDVRVRQALALAVDRLGVIRSAFGVNSQVAKQVVAYSPLVVTPHFVQPFGDTSMRGQWDPIAKRYVTYGAQALADAKKLLAEAGYPKGFPVSFMTTEGNAVRQAQFAVIEQDWSRIGVRANLTTPSATAMFSGWSQNGPLSHGEFQVAMFAFLGGPDPDGLKTNMVGSYIDRLSMHHSAINGNYAGIRDPIIDQAFRTGAGTFDKAKRAAAYRAMQVEMNKMAYWIPLFSRPSIDTANHSFTGFAPNPTSLGPTWNTFAWRPQAQ